MWKRLTLLIPLLLLTGCSVYHPLKDGVGFTDLPIGTNSFEVTYSGTDSMSAMEARQYCLFRAAELAVLHGAPYFQIIEEHIYLSYGSEYWSGGWAPAYARWGWRGGWGYVYDPGYIQAYSIPEITMRIQLAMEPGPNTIPAAYLIQKALQMNVKLTPGVTERAAGMPSGPATIPPPPLPVPRPATAPQ